MTQPIHLCLALHNHQPVGNFDHVFEQAYQDSYLPFLDVFQNYEALKISLHTSGPLMEWLDAHHPEYVDRLAQLVAAGRVEIVGGAFYEPILTMIPSRDRIGQIKDYTRWLESRLGAEIRGMWMPERVWEQQLASDLRAADIEYTLLDDFHFKNAGLDDDQLHGYFITEDDGQVVRVFPGSERLRYTIPFADPQATIDYLRESAERYPNCIRVFGDDGEKFGTWPDTKQHVYDNGWLRRFFDLLTENREWVLTTTLSEAMYQVPPVGKIYLPEGSYREMTEWALPVERQIRYEDLSHEIADDPRWPSIRQFIRGGYWRNFKVKYPETDEMYSRMMMVSQRVQEAREQGVSEEAARRGSARIVSRAMQLQLLARSFRRLLSAPFAKCRLQPSHRSRQLAGPSPRRAEIVARGRGGRFQFRCATRSPSTQRKARLPARSQPRRTTLRVRCPQYLPQPSGDTRAACRSLSPESARRTTRPARRCRQHS